MKLNCSKLNDKDIPKVDLQLLNNVSISLFFYTEEEFLEFLRVTDQTPYLKRYIRSMLNNTRINFDSFGPYNLTFDMDTIINNPANYKGKKVAFKVLGRLRVNLQSSRLKITDPTITGPIEELTKITDVETHKTVERLRWYQKVFKNY